MTSTAQKKRPRWTQPEIDHLVELVGDYYISKLTFNYNRWATRNNYPSRSQGAIEDRIEKLGLSRRPEGLWMMLVDMAKILGRSRQTIRNWVGKGWIPAEYVQRPSPQMTLIHRDGMSHLARIRPEVFAGCSLYSLLATLGSEPLAEAVHERLEGRRWKAQRCPVECVETGQRFPSIEAAAKAVYITPHAIHYAITRGWRAADKHWRSLGGAQLEASSGMGQWAGPQLMDEVAA